MENQEVHKLCYKLGSNGSIISGVFLIGSLLHEEKPPLITFGILSVSLIGFNLLLVKEYKYKKIKRKKIKSKIKK